MLSTCPMVHSFVCYLWIRCFDNELTEFAVDWHQWSARRVVKRLALWSGLRSSKFKVTQCYSFICKPGGGIILDSFGRVCFLIILYTLLYALTTEQRTIIQQYGDWYTGCWWVDCYIWYSKDGRGRGRSPPNPLLAVPNVTVHPPTASVPTSCY